MSWNAFASSITSNPVQFIKAFMNCKQRFIARRLIGTKYYVHTKTVNNGMACAVRIKCPFCYETSHKLPEDLRTPEHLPQELFNAVTRLDLEQAGIIPEELLDDIADLEKLIKRMQVELEVKKEIFNKFHKRQRQNDE